jgi:hypothetical protein
MSTRGEEDEDPTKPYAWGASARDAAAEERKRRERPVTVNSVTGLSRLLGTARAKPRAHRLDDKDSQRNTRHRRGHNTRDREEETDEPKRATRHRRDQGEGKRSAHKRDRDATSDEDEDGKDGDETEETEVIDEDADETEEESEPRKVRRHRAADEPDIAVTFMGMSLRDQPDLGQTSSSETDD